MTEAIEKRQSEAVLGATLRELEKVEHQLAALKQLEQAKKDLLEELFYHMDEFNIKKWETPGGVKITRVDPIPASIETITKFDEAAFKMDDPDTYEMYCRKVNKENKGRKGYVRVTVPKDE